jgi:hypothetical protein
MRFAMMGAGLALGLTLGAASASQATTLTFDGNICDGVGGVCTNYALINQSYGDTANVDVQYNRNVAGAVTGTPEARLSYWKDDYNNLQNVAWGTAGQTSMVLLKPTGGSVTLNGFDLGGYFRAVTTTQVTIVDGLGGILFSSGPITVGTGNVFRHFSFNLTSNNGIGIQWGPDAFNTGIDNVDFSFTPNGGGGVPEPATWAMMIAGFGLTGMAIRRRRSAFAA